MAKAIDFKYLKQEADFLEILAHYDLKATGKGVSRSILCPFHNDKQPSCKINLGRKIFHCFGCGAKGNVLEFVRRKENLAEDDLRTAARTLAEICGLPLRPPSENPGDPATRATRPAEPPSGPKTTEEPPSVGSPRHQAPAGSGGVPDVPARNEPLSPDFISRFEAKLVREHPYLAERGLSPELVAHFGLGFCPVEAKSMMKNRVVIPIHDGEGRLLAYAGRFVGGKLPEGEAKYLLPKGFHKQLVLYNLHRVQGRKHLVVVEGFFGVTRLQRLGAPAVALMGRSLSEEQTALLRASGVKYLTVLLDGDEAGRTAVPAVMERLAREPLLVKFGLLPEGSQPDTAPEAVLCGLLRLRS